jgi:DMSO/TMAO reductase YedYZ molybdopterin-dependent catalytic subunit
MRLAVILALAAMLFATPLRAEDGGLKIEGAVEHPASFSLEALRKMPATNEAIFFHTGRGAAGGSFTGVLLWTLLQESGVKPAEAKTADMLRKYLVARGGDGYYVVIALAELDPEFGGQQALIAYEQDGKPLDERSGPLRLIVPGDKGGGRNVMRLVSIELRAVAP